MGRIYRKAFRKPRVAWAFWCILLGFSSCQCSVSESETKSKGSTSFQRITGEDSEQDRSHWDSLYDKESYVFGKEPAGILKKFVDVLPVGRALDLAMGEGRNAVFLAKKGFIVDGVDISEVALRKANRLARELAVTVNTINADLNHYQIKADTYEVILNIAYLQRSLIPQIKKGLKHGGVVVFENYTVDQLKNPGGQGMNREWCLDKGELREAFKEFQIVHYAETNDGREALASLVAMKP